VNVYKLAWLEEVGNGSTVRVKRKKVNKSIAKSTLQHDPFERATRQIFQSVLLGAAHGASKHAAQSMITGRAGMALRVGGRIGLRVVPVVGAVMMAKDIYDIGKFLLD